MEYVCRRKSIRIEKYDYSQIGAYFITICAQDHKHLFGKIVNREMVFNPAGVMIKKWCFELENKFKNVTLDEYIIMPNHFHGIIVLKNLVGAALVAALQAIVSVI